MNIKATRNFIFNSELKPMATYTTTITWSNDSPDTFTKNRYSRGHEWSFDGGITVPASSSPHVVPRFSVENAVDPEEALVASASSCHMLSFLYLAAKAGFNAMSYVDNAAGEMEKNAADGKEWMARITLEPKITWADAGAAPTEEQLAELHHQAHELCYIANSLKTEIVVK